MDTSAGGYTSGGIRMAKQKVEAGKVNKTQLVSEAIEALGGDPGPKDIIQYIKDKHNLEFKYALVASYKSQIMSKKGRSAGRIGALTGTVNLKDLQTVKDLLSRLGESQLQSVIKALR